LYFILIRHHEKWQTWEGEPRKAEKEEQSVLKEKAIRQILEEFLA